MTAHRKTDYRLRRLDASRLELPNGWGIPVRVFANDGVPIERVAIDELLSLLELQDTIAAMQAAAPELFDHVDAGVEAVSLSSDFHKGRGIPIGTTLKTRGVAVPQAVGTDVNCGMRVMLTGLMLGQIEGHPARGDAARGHSRYPSHRCADRRRMALGVRSCAQRRGSRGAHRRRLRLA
jgi:tRNA-splicing ligase RtcB (3'-phosphate/5'-hydroxy nucleic acid ligase)